jgi:hypothetical protein
MRAFIRIEVVNSKGTRPPAATIALTYSPSLVPFAISWRIKSPVEIC